jgi:hypothetical protein
MCFDAWAFSLSGIPFLFQLQIYAVLFLPNQNEHNPSGLTDAKRDWGRREHLRLCFSGTPNFSE